MAARPGWKTSEFWAVVAIAVGSAASSIAGNLPDKWAALASSIAVGAYAVGRGLAKAPAVPASGAGPAAAELLATRDRLTAELAKVQAQLAQRGGTAKAEV